MPRENPAKAFKNPLLTSGKPSHPLSPSASPETVEPIAHVSLSAVSPHVGWWSVSGRLIVGYRSVSGRLVVGYRSIGGRLVVALHAKATRSRKTQPIILKTLTKSRAAQTDRATQLRKCSRTKNDRALQLRPERPWDSECGASLKKTGHKPKNRLHPLDPGSWDFVGDWALVIPARPTAYPPRNNPTNQEYLTTETHP